jgi:hypothetical protein
MQKISQLNLPFLLRQQFYCHVEQIITKLIKYKIKVKFNKKAIIRNWTRKNLTLTTFNFEVVQTRLTSPSTIVTVANVTICNG